MLWKFTQFIHYRTNRIRAPVKQNKIYIGKCY